MFTTQTVKAGFHQIWERFPFYFYINGETFEVCVTALSGIIFRDGTHLSEVTRKNQDFTTEIISCCTLAVAFRKPALGLCKPEQ